MGLRELGLMHFALNAEATQPRWSYEGKASFPAFGGMKDTSSGKTQIRV
jgi:hypothetical protein